MSPWVSDRWANNINYLKNMCVFFFKKKTKSSPSDNWPWSYVTWLLLSQTHQINVPLLSQRFALLFHAAVAAGTMITSVIITICVAIFLHFAYLLFVIDHISGHTHFTCISIKISLKIHLDTNLMYDHQFKCAFFCVCWFNYICFWF